MPKKKMLHKNWNIRMDNLESLRELVTIVRWVLETFNYKELKRLHFPQVGNWFHTHPDTFCCMAERILHNENVWEKLEDHAPVAECNKRRIRLSVILRNLH